MNHKLYAAAIAAWALAAIVWACVLTLHYSERYTDRALHPINHHMRAK